jgi:hypothetical protein
MLPTMSTAAAEEWLWQPGESPRAYAAFCRYRDQGPSRSIARAWREQQEGNGSRLPTAVPGRWTACSRGHEWLRRAEAYDNHISDALVREQVQHRLRVQARHAAQAERLVTKLFRQINRALDRARVERLSCERFLRCVERVIMLERCVHLEPLTGKVALESLVRPALPAPPAAPPEPEGAPVSPMVEEDGEPPALLPLPAPKRRESHTPRRAVAGGL